MSSSSDRQDSGASLGVSILCPKCGTGNSPKDQSLMRQMLDKGTDVAMKCAQCGSLLSYNRVRGRVTTIDEESVIDTGDILMADTLNHQGVQARREGRPAEARVLHEQALQIYEKMHMHSCVLKTRATLALAIEAEGDLHGALAMLRQCESLAHELGDEKILQAVLGNQASLLADIGDIRQAATLLEQQAEICRKLGDAHMLGQNLVNRGLLLVRGLNEYEEGIQILAEGIRECLANDHQVAAKAGLAGLGQAAANILLPILKFQAFESPETMRRQALEVREYGLEFRESTVYVYAAQALAQILLNADGGSAALQSVDDALAQCRTANWPEVEGKLTAIRKEVERLSA